MKQNKCQGRVWYSASETAQETESEGEGMKREAGAEERIERNDGTQQCSVKQEWSTGGGGLGPKEKLGGNGRNKS